MPRYAASVQYDGSGYHGWQRLTSGLPTVQAAVEQALSTVADHPVTVVCAGRTDAGVHGCNQIIHFDTTAQRSERNWTYGANRYLPRTVAVNWVKPVNDAFHARFSAQWRRYCYVLYNHPIRPVHLATGVTWYCRLLDEQRMQVAANYLIGEHDFTAYRAAQCQAKQPIRRITRLQVRRPHDHLVTLDIQANGFLHHMVRNIAGVLMAVGSGDREPVWAHTVLATKNRCQGSVTAAANGLYFMAAGYPCTFGLPTKARWPYFLC